MTQREFIEKLKPHFTKWFRWWWNQQGTNTEQGFDEWIKSDGGKEFESDLSALIEQEKRKAFDDARKMEGYEMTQYKYRNFDEYLKQQ